MARSLNEVLQSTSDTLFPADLGNARVDIASKDCDGDTPLHVVTWRNDAQAVDLLLAAGANPNAVGDMGETPLHVACRAGNESIVRSLLEAGARPDIRSEFDQTPLEMSREIPALEALFRARR